MRESVRYVRWLGALLTVMLLAMPAAAEPSQTEVIAQFDKLVWPRGGSGPAGRARALRAAGYKPTKKPPSIKVSIRAGKVSVIELHQIAPPPCPPCRCSGEGPNRRCAPCVACRQRTLVTFSATWSLDGDVVNTATQVGPRLEPP